ncbi:uncharacterized protein EV420DRAFT_1640309 [Desarmillaria tabescens]|uniref:Uncharacterized protein n=1 Tax=Armillaria tabescens TaxID=1929756 RepID=A0AA39NAF2_ARMTA|nr:uncharacterized protein EV420DRAFT_1640309 [Desarmillaria tabescens]KAK0462017.1 hypothetical protein EV420DRAFT_1640309 [Desarmillaria tabescens]
MSAQQTATQFASPEFSSVGGGQVANQTKGAVAPKEALKLRLDLNLEVEIAIQAKVNGDITLSLLYVELSRILERSQPDYWAYIVGFLR